MTTSHGLARDAAVSICRRLQAQGYRALLAGGCVRDRLLGTEPKDYDVATDATADDVCSLFEDSRGVGKAFGVVIVRVGGESVEVASFREDVGIGDGRHPVSVRPADPETDAQRRDFTINGLFEDPIGGEVLDFVGGRDDLRRRRVRAIGDPVLRFAEDRLRMLRAVRFATVLDFTIDPATAAAIRDAAPGAADLARERVRDELSRIVLSGRGGRGLGLLHELRLLPLWLPEVEALIGVPQPARFHPEGDVFTHTRMLLDGYREGGLSVALAALLHDIGKAPTLARDETGRYRFARHASVGAEMAETVLERLRYPNRIQDEVRELVARHMDWPSLPRMREAKRRRFLLRDDFDAHLELHRLDCEACHRDLGLYDQAREERERLLAEPPPIRPLVCGDDLIEMGFTPGPAFGDMLRDLVDLQLEDRIRTAAEARAHLLASYELPSGRRREVGE